jgi:plasmid stabilization system protein ParE
MATRVLAKIESSCKRLLKFMLSGATRMQFAPDLRVTFEGNYAIYYVITKSDLFIVRVLHSARDADALAERGGFS